MLTTEPKADGQSPSADGIGIAEDGIMCLLGVSHVVIEDLDSSMARTACSPRCEHGCYMC
jgi:hypothetical protein